MRRRNPLLSISLPEATMSQILSSPTWRAAVLACLLLSACGERSSTGDRKDAAESPAEVSTPVEVVRASRQPLLSSYAGTASLEAEREAQVVAKTSGVLLQLLVEEGDRVREGQALAQLDPERPRLEVARAEADLRRLENEFRRSEELFGAKLVSSEAHDRIRFSLETQRAAWELAKLELSYTRITAPIDGVVSQRLVKEGNFIQAQAPLFRISDFDPLQAVLNVPERELRTMRAGLTVTMAVDAVPDAAFEGVVARVSPVVDPGTGTFRVTCEFRDPSERLKPGMFGRLGVVYEQRADVLVVPREALLEGESEVAVFMVREGKATRVPVRTGARSGGMVEVVEGVAEGDSVVTVGAATLRDGASVQVLEGSR
jgi:membrane fusion protein (multidrug efflux system)